MPTIEVSAGAFTDFANRLTNFYGCVPAPNGSAPGAAYKSAFLLQDNGNSNISVIRIYSGTRQSAWMGTTVSADASGGRLLQFAAVAHYTSVLGPVTYSVTGTSPLTHTTQISTTLNTAINSGTATWFLLGVVNGGQTTAGTTLYQQITGTVGVVGSGADLILSDTNIVAGQTYKVVDLRLSMSSVFTYT